MTETENVWKLELLETATDKYACAYTRTRMFDGDFNEIYFLCEMIEFQMLGLKEFITPFAKLKLQESYEKHYKQNVDMKRQV